jgi:hypothetical protein
LPGVQKVAGHSSKSVPADRRERRVEACTEDGQGRGAGADIVTSSAAQAVIVDDVEGRGLKPCDLDFEAAERL